MQIKIAHLEGKLNALTTQFAVIQKRIESSEELDFSTRWNLEVEQRNLQAQVDSLKTLLSLYRQKVESLKHTRGHPSRPGTSPPESVTAPPENKSAAAPTVVPLPAAAPQQVPSFSLSPLAISGAVPANQAVQVRVGDEVYAIDSPQLVPALRTALAGDDEQARRVAIIAATIHVSPGFGSGREVGPFSELAPELIGLLGHVDLGTRELAQYALLCMRSKVEDALQVARDSSNPEIAKRVQKLLAQTEPVPTVMAMNQPVIANPVALPSANQPASGAPGPTPYSPYTPANSPTSVAPPSAMPVPPNPAPTYQDRTFEQWQQILETELDPESRLDALQAMRQFAANGFAEQVVTLVTEKIGSRSLTIWDDDEIENPDAEQMEQVMVAAIQAIRGGPVEDVVPLLAEYAKTGSKSERIFALCAFPPTLPESMSVLLELMHDDDRTIRELAAARAAHGDASAVGRQFSEGLASDDAATRLWAAQMCRNVMEIGLQPLDVFARKLAAVLDDSDAQVRAAAFEALAKLGAHALPTLKEIEASADAKAAKRAREVRTAIEVKLAPASAPGK